LKYRNLFLKIEAYIINKGANCKLANLPALFGEKAWKLKLIIPLGPKMKGEREGFRIDPM
jgi:hypothetical protein